MHWDTGTVPQTLSNGWQNAYSPKVLFHPIKSLPYQVTIQQIDNAVKSFADEVDVKGDKVGFINQTLESIANATFFKGQGSTNDFWACYDNEGLQGYVLSNTAKDVDNQLCYWISQAWMSKKYRGTGLVKQFWEDLREYAKEHFCKHILIVSGRGSRSYPRLLGKNVKEYATVFKEDI